MPDWLKALRPVDRELMARWTAEQGLEPWWTASGLGLSARAIALMDRAHVEANAAVLDDLLRVDMRPMKNRTPVPEFQGTAQG
jgi:hypothetical protein